MGVTGANFLIAETGSATVVTNEGNEGMCTILPPKVHVVLTGIEKVLPDARGRRHADAPAAALGDRASRSRTTSRC